MKKSTIIIFLTLVSIPCLGVLPDDTPELMLAMAFVESKLDARAVGDFRNGKPMAKGVFQIWENYWIDGCNYLKVDWEYTKYVWDVDYSARIVLAYLEKYGKFYKQKTGKDPSLEILARIHNGGPYGWCDSNENRYKNTTEYWKKVKPILERIKNEKM